MDETCIKAKGNWTYLCRAVDRIGQTLDFMLSKHSDTSSARRFFGRAIGVNGGPDRIVIGKSRADLAGLQSLNVIRKFTSAGRIIKILRVEYPDNAPEQDPRFIKRITGPTQGFMTFRSAAATRAGIEPGT